MTWTPKLPNVLDAGDSAALNNRVSYYESVAIVCPWNIL